MGHGEFRSSGGYTAIAEEVGGVTSVIGTGVGHHLVSVLWWINCHLEPVRGRARGGSLTWGVNQAFTQD